MDTGLKSTFRLSGSSVLPAYPGFIVVKIPISAVSAGTINLPKNYNFSLIYLVHVMMEPSKIWALSLSGVMSELVNLLEGKGSIVLPLIRPIMTKTWATYPLNFSIKSLATRSVQPSFKFNLIKIT